MHFAWEGGTTCSQESAPSSQTEGPLEMALPGLRLWAQRGSFFLLLAAELTSGGAGFPLLCWPVSDTLCLETGLLDSCRPSPCRLMQEEALFTIFFFFYSGPSKKKVRVFKKIVCHFI